MSKEIKFRDYDFDTNKLRYFDLDGYDRQEHDCYGNVVRFIGIKDHNGKDIYEGDIVRILYTDWHSNTDPNITLEDYLISISHVGEIAYEAPQFGVMLEDRYGDKSLMNSHIGEHGRLEVIGNRFENPELV